MGQFGGNMLSEFRKVLIFQFVVACVVMFLCLLELVQNNTVFFVWDLFFFVCILVLMMNSEYLHQKGKAIS